MKKLICAALLSALICPQTVNAFEAKDLPAGNIDITGKPVGFRSEAGYIYGIEIKDNLYFVGMPGSLQPQLSDCFDKAMSEEKNVRIKGKIIIEKINLGGKPLENREFSKDTVCTPIK